MSRLRPSLSFFYIPSHLHKPTHTPVDVRRKRRIRSNHTICVSHQEVRVPPHGLHMYQDTEVFNIDKPGLVSETFPEFCQMTLANILSRLQDLRCTFPCVSSVSPELNFFWIQELGSCQPGASYSFRSAPRVTCQSELLPNSPTCCRYLTD